MATLLYPAINVVVYDHNGGLVTAAGVSVATVTGYYTDLITRGYLLTYDPLGATPTTVVTDLRVDCLTVVALGSTRGEDDGQFAFCSGYYALGDGGGGTFVWAAASTATAVAGMVIGTGTGRWLRAFSGAVDVRWLGAKCDGTTNDIAALQAAASYCATNGLLITASGGSSVINATLEITCSGDLSSLLIKCPGATVSPAVKVGLTTGTGNDAQLRLDLTLPRIVNTSKTTTGWSGFSSSVGVYSPNLYESRITIPLVQGFGVGVLIGGTTAGNVYNDYMLGMLWQNKIQLKISPQANTGWANENNFYGGRFGYDTSEGVEVSGVYSILLSNYPGSTVGQPNNNVFYRPCLEGDEPEFHLNFEDAAMNTFIAPRFEHPTTPPKIRFYSSVSGETNSNLIIGGFRNLAFEITRAGQPSLYNKMIGGRLCDALEYTGCGESIVNKSGSTHASPHIQGFAAGQYAIDKTQANTDWVYRLHGGGLALKTPAATYPQYNIADGYFYMGDGSSEPTSWIRGAYSASEIETNSIVYPDLNNVRDLGFTGRRWRGLYAQFIRVGATEALILTGTGSPETVVTAGMGSIYTNTDGGAGATLYVKESGTGNTGWVAK